MLIEKRNLKYRGKIVFEKVRMKKFSRVPKFYDENEACFIFLDGGKFTLRSSDNIVKLDAKSALLSKCVNYFFELPEEENKEVRELEAVGVMIHKSIISELFNIEMLSQNYSKRSTMQPVDIDPLLDAFKTSISFLIDNPSLADDDMIELKLKEFVKLLLRQNDNDSIQSFFSKLFDPVIYNIEQTIENNLNANLSIEELAFLTNMSASSFKRKFKSIYQKSPHQYILTCLLYTSPSPRD